MTPVLRMPGVVAAAVILQLGAVGAALPQSAPIEGTWTTELRSEITIEPCAEGYCGRLSKIVVPQKYIDQYGDQLKDMPVEEYFDANNKDPALRQRPVLDLQILSLHATDNPFRYDGKIYNPEDGETYDGYVEVLGADAIKLTGCVLYGTICQGQDWQRVIAPPETEAATDAQPIAPIPAIRTSH